MTDRLNRKKRAWAAALGWAFIAGLGAVSAAAPAVNPAGANPARPAAPGAPARPAATPPTQANDVATPAPPPAVRSEVGHRMIRREGGPAVAPSTQPDLPSAEGPAPAGSTAAPTLELPKVAGALAIVLALILGLRSVMKKAFVGAGGAAASRAVTVLSRTILTPKQHLLLLQVGRRLIVVADSGGQMSPLTEITDPDEVASLVGQLRDEKLSAAAPTFGGLLGKVRRGMEAGGAEEAEPARPTPQADPYNGRGDGGGVDEPEVGSTRQEINGLLAKVRMLSHQFKGS